MYDLIGIQDMIGVEYFCLFRIGVVSLVSLCVCRCVTRRVVVGIKYRVCFVGRV